MTCTVLPFTEDLIQVMTLTVSPDGEPLQARLELRWSRGAGRWLLSLWDEAAGDLLAGNIPLQTSENVPDDLLRPFRYLRQGRGIGSLFCLRKAANPATLDPGEGNMSEFNIVWGDTYE